MSDHAGVPYTPDLIVRGCTALLRSTWTDVEFVPGTTIEITGSRISHIGRTASDPTPPHTAEVIDAAGLVALPGLINTHTHAAMTLLRGAAEDVAVGNWFNDYIWPMEVNVTAADVHLGTLLAAAEMIESGVTTFADHYFFMDDAARAVVECGIRADLGSAFFSTQGDEGVEASSAFAERWHGTADGRITASLAPHAPYTVSDEHLRSCADHARRLGVRVHTHAAEDIAQTRSSLATRGATPVRVLADTGVLDAGCIIAHGNGIVADDIPVLAEHADRVGVTHGPKGYLKFALGPLTPIAALQAVGVPVGYCTDGAASNNTLDILESMRVTALSQKHARDDATWFTSAAALHMAGPASASVLGRGHDLGRLAVGCLADLILVDLGGVHCQPVHDIAAALVYCARASDVRTTIVDGRVLMRDRRLTTIDRAAMLTEVRRRAREITDRSHGRTIQDYAP